MNDQDLVKSLIREHKMEPHPEGGHYVEIFRNDDVTHIYFCLLYTSPSPRDTERSRMPSSA